MRNNNREVLSLLARECYRHSRARNRILTGAVAFSVFALFCIFSLALGRINADFLLSVRNSGTAAYTTLERASKEQQEQINALPYIKETGRSVDFGHTEFFGCAWLDQNAWETMQSPAYTDICGSYPEKEYEVMLPVRSLEAMGISEPETGMELTLSISLENGETLQRSFVLCGYYTEYLNMSVLPSGYFSEAFLNTLSVDLDECTTLLIQQNDTLRDTAVEEQLYADVDMRDDSQQFFGGNSFAWQSVADLAGGFDTAALLAAVILLAVWLLIHNVLQISLSRDIRQYGLLKTLGATERQLRDIVLLQTVRVVLWGCLFGASAGTLAVLAVFPALLSRLYLYGLGSASAMTAFHPLLLALSVLFSALVTFFSAFFAVRKTARMSPADAARYVGASHSARPAKRAGKRPAALLQNSSSEGIAAMAWGNVWRFPGRLALTILSLALGITASLGAAMISGGTDTTNQIDRDFQGFDFKLSSQFFSEAAAEHPADTVFFPSELSEQILSLDGIERAQRSRGAYGKMAYSEEALAVYLEELAGSEGYKAFQLQAVSDEWLDDLEALAAEQKLPINIESVREQNGALALHYHALSAIQQEQGASDVGKTFSVCDLDSGHEQTLSFAGYLDFKQKGLPDFQNTTIGGGILYFLVSERTLESLGFTEQLFGLTFCADPEKEPLLKETIQGMVDAHNLRVSASADTAGMKPLISVLCKSDVLASAKSYISASRLVMGSLCAILLLLGLVNYMNVMLTSLAVRRKELAVLESLGAVRRQLRRMLALEGVFYSLFVLTFVLTAGNLILYLTALVMDSRIAYFKFRYPAASLLICAAALFAACLAIPLLLYRNFERESVITRLRIYTD